MHFKNLFQFSSKTLLFISIAFFISVSEVKSQKDLTLDEVKIKLDELYQNKKWNELIIFGNKTLKDNTDFYSLRVKLGIAYFEKEKYLYAIENLEIANKTDIDEQEVLEKLYFSYYYMGRSEEANYTFSKLSESRKYRIKPLNNEFIESFNAESGISISNDESKNGNVNIQGSKDLSGEQVINKNSFLLNIGLSQMPVSIFSIFYDYTYQNLQKQKVIEYNGIKTTNDFDQLQSQFYNRLDFLIGNGFTVNPAARYIGYKETTIYAEYDSNSSSINYVNPESDSSAYNISYNDKITSAENFILSLSVSKGISLFKLGINGSFSFLNENHQYQIGTAVSYFPFANKTFYSTSNIVLHSQNSVANLIITQLFGGKIKKDFLIEGYATFGKIYNYNEENGFIVFNNSDATTFKFGANLKYSVSNSLNLYLIYLNQQRERNYTVYNIPQNTIQSTQTLDYSVNTILAGMKISF